jgi:hypothetical protein
MLQRNIRTEIEIMSLQTFEKLVARAGFTLIMVLAATVPVSAFAVLLQSF